MLNPKPKLEIQRKPKNQDSETKSTTPYF